jgi:hypothetical protein
MAELDFFGKALELASQIRHPVTAAAFTTVLLVFALYLWSRKRKLSWQVLAVFCLVGFIGWSPLAASVLVQFRGMYRVHVDVLRPDGTPVDGAEITSTVGGELKKVGTAWELDISPQTRPIDGKLVILASAKSEFLTGQTSLTLGEDYYPSVVIQLVAHTSAMVRGVVVNRRGRSVPGVRVSVVGFQESVLTDQGGNFALPAHGDEGQVVRIRAEKGLLHDDETVPAGSGIELVIK